MAARLMSTRVARRIAGVALLLAIGGLPSRACAQGSSADILSDAAADDLVQLLDAGLVPLTVVGQAPYARMTLAKAALSADSMLTRESALGGARRRALRDACDRLLRRFAEEVGALRGNDTAATALHLFGETLLDGGYTDAVPRAIRENGVGSVEADVNPLARQLPGRRIATGGHLAIESESWVRIGSRLTLSARPRVSAHDASRAAGARSAELLTASARFATSRAAVTVGREYTDWSIAPGGGLFFSAESPALDLVRVSTEAPFRFPSVLGRLGPTSATVQVASLGASVSHSHSLLVAYKVSVHPASTLQVGGSFANHFGGDGAVNPRIVRRLVDLLPFLDLLQHHADSTDFDSDKLLGLDARLRLPALGGTTLYGEMALEDFDVHRMRSILTEDAAYILGARIPAFLRPSLTASLSYHVTGIRFYEHHALLNGIAASRVVLGDPLGRDAGGFRGGVEWQPSTALSVYADAAYESRGNSTYIGEYTSPGAQDLVFRVVTAQPPEIRRRVSGRLVRHDVLAGGTLSVRAGAERITGPALPGSTRATHGVLDVTLTLLR